MKKVKKKEINENRSEAKQEKDRKKVKKVIEIIVMIVLLIPFIFWGGGSVLLLIIGSLPRKGIPFEERESVAVETATAYVQEKYGDALTYCGVNDGKTAIVNAETYWDVFFCNEEGNTFKCRVFCSDDKENMYIDYETYYSHYIREDICDWAEEQVEDVGIVEYIIEYHDKQEFSTEWLTTYSTEEVLRLLPKQKGYISINVCIPEREFGKYDSNDITKGFSELEECTNGFIINLVVYPDEIFDSFYEDDVNRIQFVEKINIIGG